MEDAISSYYPKAEFITVDHLTEMGASAGDTMRNDWKFVIFLTLSLASKFHIAVVLPLFFLYLYKKKGRKKAIVMTGLLFLCLSRVCPGYAGIVYRGGALFYFIGNFSLRRNPG